MANIEPGYMLKITTWENDADNYNTLTKTGLTKEDTIFYIKVAKLFISCNNRDAKENYAFGNSDVFRTWDIEDFPIEGPYPDRSGERYRRRDDMMLPLRAKEVIDAHKAEYGSVPEYYEYDNPKWGKAPVSYKDFRDFFNDVLYDLVGKWCDGDYWRVFENFEVFLVPGEIKNVTEEFK